MTDYIIKGAEIGLFVGFVFYFTCWGLFVGLRLFKIIT